MNRLILKTILLYIVISIFAAAKANYVDADWWERPSIRPTSPSYERDLSPLPTSPSLPTPTSIVNHIPTPTSIVPTPTSGALTPTPQKDEGTKEDPCAPGKSFYGPNCGFSPRVGGEISAVTVAEEVPVAEPQILALSDTASYDLAFSDIIFLIGILCLLLYVRSKLVINQSHS